ncbi:MAG: hypothetical protein PHH37_07075 [Paludibacter sp.]|nr:hypothetical protein [Paludibacter sp.]
MKFPSFFIILCLLFITSACNSSQRKYELKAEIYDAENAFQKMVRDSGSAKAFYYFADENAVILRDTDILIKGRDAISNYYPFVKNDSVSLRWAPDFIDVSDDGTIAYSYGKYVWERLQSTGDTLVHTGIFHTVWKRQTNGKWKFVWD